MKAPIPADWDGVSFCRFAICWPDSPRWRIILRGVLTEPTRGYFWDERTGSVLGVLSDIRQTLDYNLALWEVIMACNDNGLQSLAAAVRLLAKNQCCDGIGENGGIVLQIDLGEAGVLPIYGSGPPAELPPSGYPENYSNQEEYDVDKCRLANKMTTDFISSLSNLSTIFWVQSITGTAVVLGAIVGLISLPVVAIPTLLFLLIGTVGINAGLIALANEIEANYDEWVCTFYQGQSMSIIYSVISNLLDTAIAAITVSTGLGFALKTIALTLLSADTVSVLFSGDNKGAYPEADCSGCGGCPDISVTSDSWFTNPPALYASAGDPPYLYFDNNQSGYYQINILPVKATQIYFGSHCAAALGDCLQSGDLTLAVRYTDGTEDDFEMNTTTNYSVHPHDLDGTKTISYIRITRTAVNQQHRFAGLSLVCVE